MKKYEDFDEVKLVKGNIPIDKSLFNKYKNVEEIFSSCKKNYSKYDSGIVLPDNIFNTNELENLSRTEIQNLTIKIFNKYHDTKIFYNTENKIIITNKDLKESIHKIIEYGNQRIFLHEHMIIFANLGYIITNASLINQTKEQKARKTNILWSYYISCIKINNRSFLILFDVLSRTDGENHLRIQRLELIS